MKGSVKPATVKVVLKKDQSNSKTKFKTQPKVQMFISNWSTNEKTAYSVPKQFQNSESPVRKQIKEMEDRICEFDINSIWRWTPHSVRKYKIFIEKFENSKALLNIMLLDHQLQDLQENHEKIKAIRNNTQQFQKLSSYLSEQHKKIHQLTDRKDTKSPDVAKDRKPPI